MIRMKLLLVRNRDLLNGIVYRMTTYMYTHILFSGILLLPLHKKSTGIRVITLRISERFPYWTKCENAEMLGMK